jgi:hypothetical protein
LKKIHTEHNLKSYIINGLRIEIYENRKKGHPSVGTATPGSQIIVGYEFRKDDTEFEVFDDTFEYKLVPEEEQKFKTTLDLLFNNSFLLSKEASSDNEKEASSDNEKEASSDNEKEASSDNEKESANVFSINETQANREEPKRAMLSIFSQINGGVKLKPTEPIKKTKEKQKAIEKTEEKQISHIGQITIDEILTQKQGLRKPTTREETEPIIEKTKKKQISHIGQITIDEIKTQKLKLKRTNRENV